jgi:hypothetical protein
MTRSARIAAWLGAMLALMAPVVAQADPWKDESGHGRREWERREGGPLVVVPVPVPMPVPMPLMDYAHPPARYVAPRIPGGHLPPPGECRVWFPDRPAGHQPPPGRC